MPHQSEREKSRRVRAVAKKRDRLLSEIAEADAVLLDTEEKVDG
jgi:hypothetical protein